MYYLLSKYRNLIRKMDALSGRNNVLKDPLNPKSTLKKKTSSLSFIESVHVQQCQVASLPTPPYHRFWWNSNFKLTQNEPVDHIGLEIYNLYKDDLREIFRAALFTFLPPASFLNLVNCLKWSWSPKEGLRHP